MKVHERVNSGTKTKTHCDEERNKRQCTDAPSNGGMLTSRHRQGKKYQHLVQYCSGDSLSKIRTFTLCNTMAVAAEQSKCHGRHRHEHTLLVY